MKKLHRNFKCHIEALKYGSIHFHSFRKTNRQVLFGFESAPEGMGVIYYVLTLFGFDVVWITCV